ncbi:hypothetical protein [Curtobacterium ammoniigenes]|uniref:hypothetical protein n=1 Tax=Curtobacterium ammoniigenes TaxID=395387 RepID=UPI0012ECBEDE|nr:hypothetical protein [Curtobacterium ammoniigenes]
MSSRDDVRRSTHADRTVQGSRDDDTLRDDPVTIAYCIAMVVVVATAVALILRLQG